MARITVSEDCGNAPKKQYVKDFLVHCAKGEIDSAAEMLADDVEVDIPGFDSAQGLDAVRELMSAAAERNRVATMTVANLISHGDRCAADGLLEIEKGRSVAFCSMYRFNGHGKRAKLKAISVYLVVV